MKLKDYLIKFFSAVILAGIAGQIFISCESSEGEPAVLGTEFFGHTSGKWLIYDVDSTVYDDFLGEVFHYKYQVLEINSEFFTDSEGEESMRLERFWRMTDEDEWIDKNTWRAKISGSRAFRTEENITYLKLTFPLKLNQKWNGNAFNNKPSQEYVVSHIYEPYHNGYLQFDSTVRVLQKDFVTLIGEEYQYEVFAWQVGMVKKKFVDLSKEVDGTIIRGVDYSYTLMDFGFD
ncbi:MAG: hypothetical protein EA393_07440 [Bacteroidetes bacterium]|nr:MAG: hypothetical protein EA393_07440 [Bacteroidota bacterium]